MPRRHAAPKPAGRVGPTRRAAATAISARARTRYGSGSREASLSAPATPSTEAVATASVSCAEATARLLPPAERVVGGDHGEVEDGLSVRKARRAFERRDRVRERTRRSLGRPGRAHRVAGVAV